jgi:hypothetical protein
MTQWGIDALFNPAKRHMDEEKRRLQSTREEVGDSSGGKRIDLESGKVVIARSEADDEPDGARADAEALSSGKRRRAQCGGGTRGRASRAPTALTDSP